MQARNDAYLSMVEGSVVFLGAGRRWARDAKAVRDSMYRIICASYPLAKRIAAE